MKIIHLSPKERTGVGVKIDSLPEMRSILQGAPSYGFRPISRSQAKSLMTNLSNSAMQKKLISQILVNKPVSTSDLNAKKLNAMLSGPVIAHPDLSTISKNQNRLELKLKVEAEKLFRKKYPERASIYSQFLRKESSFTGVQLASACMLPASITRIERKSSNCSLITYQIYLFSRDLDPTIETLRMIFTSISVFEDHFKHAIIVSRYLYCASNVFADESFVEFAY